MSVTTTVLGALPREGVAPHAVTCSRVDNADNDDIVGGGSSSSLDADAD